MLWSLNEEAAKLGFQIGSVFCRQNPAEKKRAAEPQRDFPQRRSVLRAALSLKHITEVLILAGCRGTAVSPLNGTVQGLSIT